MPADVQPFQPRGPSAFYGPFTGLNTDVHKRNLAAGEAAECSNVIVRDGRVTHRPGISRLPADPDSDAYLDAFHGIGMRYFDGDADYILAASHNNLVGLRHYDEHYQPALLTLANLVAPFTKCRGAIGRFGQDAYLATYNGVYKFLDALGNRNIEPTGLVAPIDPSVAVDVGTTGNLTGTLEFWMARYNAFTGVESNATYAGSGTATADWASCTLNAVLTDYPDKATHIRIYASRADGYGFPGLLAEVEIEGSMTGAAFVYTIGKPALGNEQNGGATYAIADDDTNINYVPCTQNDPPPVDTIDIAFWRNRMIYLTASGRIYFSQSVEELQGHVEHVGTLNYRTVPQGDKPVALRVYRDSLYVWTSRRVYRISGEFNSATNAQVVLGTLADEIVSTDAIELVEGTAGCVAPRAIISADTPAGEVVFYPGPAHIYAFDGVNAVAITDRKIQTRYRDRLAAATDGIVTAAHYKRDGLILFCFQDESVLAYDYTAGGWVEWLADHSRRFGPMCPRSINGTASDDAVFLQSNTTATHLFQMQLRAFDSDRLGTDITTSSAPFAASWTGPDLNMGYPHREKLYVFLQAFFTSFSTYGNGKVAAYGRRNGNSSEQYPVHATEATKWDQDISEGVDVIERMGFAGRSLQPHFELSRATSEVSELLGYGVEFTVMGRR